MLFFFFMYESHKEKTAFVVCAENEMPRSNCATAQFDIGIHYPLIQSLDSVEDTLLIRIHSMLFCYIQKIIS